MRVTMHNGRQGLAKHNDRSFEVEQAEHIAASRSEQNKYWQIPKYSGMTFAETELAFYRDEFGKGLEARNARYRAQRHNERCRSIEDLLHGDKTKPEEQILAIGDRNDAVDVDAFAACINDYVRKMDAWNYAHGEPFRLLSVAIHADERGAVHAHLRRVWVAPDRDGHLMPSQNKALERAGIERPNTNAKESRRNNRKITFDCMARKLWQETVKEHGFEIETKPVKPDRRHMKTADFIRADNAAAEEDRKVAEARINKLWKEVEGLESRKSELTRREKSLKSREHDLNEWEKLANESEAFLQKREKLADEREANLQFREKNIETKEEAIANVIVELPQTLAKLASNKVSSKVKKNAINSIKAQLEKLNLPLQDDDQNAKNAPVAGSQIPEEKRSRERSKFDTIFDKEEQEREDILREV